MKRKKGVAIGTRWNGEGNPSLMLTPIATPSTCFIVISPLFSVDFFTDPRMSTLFNSIFKQYHRRSEKANKKIPARNVFKRGFLMPRQWPDQKSMAGPMFIYRYLKKRWNRWGRFFLWRISSWCYSFVLVDVATKNNLSRPYVIPESKNCQTKNPLPK